MEVTPEMSKGPQRRRSSPGSPVAATSKLVRVRKAAAGNEQQTFGAVSFVPLLRGMV